MNSNRTASLATFIAGLCSAGSALANVWPTAATNEIATIAGGVLTLAGPLSHVVGSWFWDRTPVGQAHHAKKLGVSAPGHGFPVDEEPPPPPPGDTDLPPDLEPVDEDLDAQIWLDNRQPGQTGEQVQATPPPPSAEGSARPTSEV